MPTKTLTPDQVTQYYKEQQNEKLPLSPLDWLGKQPPVTPPAPTTSTAPTPAPVTTPTTATSTPPAPPTAQPTTDSSGLSDQKDRTELTTAQQEYQDAAKKFQDTITGIQNGAIPLSAGENAQVDYLKLQYDQFLQDQKDANELATRNQNILDYREGRTQYMPGAHIKTIADLASKGAVKIHALTAEQAAKVAELTQSLKDKDIANIKDVYASLKDANTARQTAIKDSIKEVQTAIDKANKEKADAAKVQYDQVTKPIEDLKQIAKNNSAPSSVMAAIGNAKTLDEAYQAAGDYAAQGTGAVAEYNYAKANGYKGSIMQYQQDQENMKALAKAKYDAQNTGLSLSDPLPEGLGGTSEGNSILAATGLSLIQFNYLTEGTPALTRLNETSRVQVMKSTDAWLKSHGIDNSTFKSQFKAYNEVVQRNIQRANQTKIMAGEVSGTADALAAEIEKNHDTKTDFFGNPIPSAYNKGMSSVRLSNVLDIAAGKETNNEFAMKYRTQLALMTNDLAGYLAASRGSLGADGPTESDKREAAEIVVNGMNKGTVDAFRDSINTNEEKVTAVVNKAVTNSQKQVWGIFGVGDKYKTPASAPDLMAKQGGDAKTKVDSYIQSNPDQMDSIERLYSAGNFNDEQVAEYLHL